MPGVYHEVPWIEVEAKHKEVAMPSLREASLSETRTRTPTPICILGD
ncbi:hypothetical protein [Nostoc sp. C117]